MIPRVLELLAEVGIEAEAGEVAATAAEKGFSSLLNFPIPLPLKKSRCLSQRKLRAAHRRVDRHLSHRRVPTAPILPADTTTLTFEVGKAKSRPSH
jgi:hypothetical protein